VLQHSEKGYCRGCGVQNPTIYLPYYRAWVAAGKYHKGPLVMDFSDFDAAAEWKRERFAYYFVVWC
jgi:hypothetical protein